MKEIKKSFLLGLGIGILIYGLLTLYFSAHYFYRTTINGALVSLKPKKEIHMILSEFVKEYELTVVSRTGEEKLKGKDFGLFYLPQGKMPIQNPFAWILFLKRDRELKSDNLFMMDQSQLKERLQGLSIFAEDAVLPKNPQLIYQEGWFQVTKEEEGNLIQQQKLLEAVEKSLKEGAKRLDLEQANCYVRPAYTSESEEVQQARRALNQYLMANITYRFGEETRVLTKEEFHSWLYVTEGMAPEIRKELVQKYVGSLAREYDTVGKDRKFKTALGKNIIIKGGIYGFKIDQTAETMELIHLISRGAKEEREPCYSQRAMKRGEDDIGDTYVEISLSRQYLWFFLNGTLKTHGAVVTGNPNRGWETVTGAYMLNYKQRGAVLSGPNYERRVEYWMPFFGNIGIHDATWRRAFGGEIYESRGSHGCVNAPHYLAETIFQTIDAGTPILCYE